MMQALRDETGGESGPGASLRLVVPPTPSYAKYVRDRIGSFVRSHAVPEADAHDFLTALGEALANAIEHANTRQKIEASCWIVGRDQLVATVVDSGIGFVAPERLSRDEPPTPEPYAERGRGLAIMRKCTDHVVVRSAPGRGTAVILTRFVRHRHLSVVGEPAAGR